MLTVKEVEVMSLILDTCEGKGTCMLAPIDIINGVMPNHYISPEKLQSILNKLRDESYVDIIASDKKGKKVYVFTLKSKGENFKRKSELAKSRTSWIIIRTVLLAVISFAVTSLLKLVFGF